MELRVEHGLEPEEVVERIAAISAEHDIAHEPDPAGSGGGLTKTTALGVIVARYEIERGALIVKVISKPAFPPDGMVRRALEENLGAALGDEPAAGSSPQ